MRILIAVDLNNEDVSVFMEQAVAWVVAVGGTADLIFVDEAADRNPYIGGAIGAAMSTHYEAWHREKSEQLAELNAQVPGLIKGSAEVVRGQAAVVLLDRLEGYDALILGNRPVSGFARLAHGVVAERVSRQSTIPVLILPQ